MLSPVCQCGGGSRSLKNSENEAQRNESLFYLTIDIFVFMTQAQVFFIVLQTWPNWCLQHLI